MQIFSEPMVDCRQQQTIITDQWRIFITGSDFMKTQEHIDHFSPTLTTILNQEIKLGNEVIETSKGWPEEKTIIVFLKTPFIGKYELENTAYRNIDNPHYWKAEYVDSVTNHILACRF